MWADDQPGDPPAQCLWQARQCGERQMMALPARHPRHADHHDLVGGDLISQPRCVAITASAEPETGDAEPDGMNATVVDGEVSAKQIAGELTIRGHFRARSKDAA